MKQYTVRYAHLEYTPGFTKGDIIEGYVKIGRMGNTGKSTANHLHIDVVEGIVHRLLKLSQIGYDKENEYNPNLKQLNYFIDKALFDEEIVITEYFGAPSYIGGGLHHAYDVVPENRHLEPGRNFDIYWNRTKKGVVLGTGTDEFYGNYLLVGFEA